MENEKRDLRGTWASFGSLLFSPAALSRDKLKDVGMPDK